MKKDEVKDILHQLLFSVISVMIITILDITVPVLISGQGLNSLSLQFRIYIISMVVNLIFVFILSLIFTIIGVTYKNIFRKSENWFRYFQFVVSSSIALLIVFLVDFHLNKVLGLFTGLKSIIANIVMIISIPILCYLIYLLSKLFIRYLQRKVLLRILSGIVVAIFILPTAYFAISEISDGGNTKFRPERPYNVVILTFDALRYDYVSSYGYSDLTGVETPNIDEVANSGILFENCLSPGTWTIPSLTSLITSMYPSIHGADMLNELSPDISTMPEILNDSGYRTIFITPSRMLTYQRSFQRGYENFYVYGEIPVIGKFKGTNLINFIIKVVDVIRSQMFHLGDDPTTWSTKMILSEIEKSSGNEEPLFLWSHYLDPHYPLYPPDEYIHSTENISREELITFRNENSDNFDVLTDIKNIDYFVPLYSAEVRYCDEQVKMIVQKLKELNMWDDTVFIISADHGESLGEHEHIGHGSLPYEQITHIPLIVHLPDKFSRQMRVNTPVTLLDIFPSLMEILGISMVENLDGRSFLSFLDNPEDDRFVFSQSIENSGKGKEFAYTCRDRNFAVVKDIDNDRKWFFNLLDDRVEKNPLPVDDIPDEMIKAIEIWRAYLEYRKKEMGETTTEIDIDEETKEEIRGLGYVIE